MPEFLDDIDVEGKGLTQGGLGETRRNADAQATGRDAGHLRTDALKPEPAVSKAAGLSIDRRPSGTVTPSAGSLPQLPGAPEALSPNNRRPSDEPPDGSRPKANPSKSSEAPRIAASDSASDDVPVDLERSAAEFGGQSPLLAVAIIPDKLLAVEPKRAGDRPRAGVQTPVNLADASAGEAISGDTHRRSNVQPSVDQHKSGQAVDSFLTDLTRQLDGIQLLSPRPPKR
jgi:hypothetical protein